MSTTSTSTSSKRKRTLSTIALLIFLTVFALALALTLDTDAMVNAAYSWPSLTWRLVTYGIILIKTGKNARIPLALFSLFNEMVIWTYWTGAFQWS
ncbi:hypothetical protein C4G53_RS21850 [Vibrio parahaemolyticus]|nr:hypothetical protein [Vibrio parahaemolyticus]EIA1589982.1 hypothetical protein [Vibrio parahaemolyticus]EJE8675331.1 hypothetical protein [Vibrio parahaemolyticus]EJG1086389.1 hypothetical protein [Vibrio parahaemolyticus]